jgi:hypothetical protein
MQHKGKLILLGIVIVIAASFVLVWWFLGTRSIPDFNAKPVPANAPTLNEADIEKVLGVKQFYVVRRVRQVPNVVKESFSNFTRIPFDLVDPAEQMISDDMTTPAKSSRRLVFLGLSEDSAILVYEQGGLADVCNIAVFWYGDGGRGWVATLDYLPIPTNIAALKAVIQKGKFHVWERQQ